MSNRTGKLDTIPPCSNTDKRGVCMYAGPCLECACARARQRATVRHRAAKPSTVDDVERISIGDFDIEPQPDGSIQIRHNSLTGIVIEPGASNLVVIRERKR